MLKLKIYIVCFDPHNISLFLVNTAKVPWACLKGGSTQRDKNHQDVSSIQLFLYTSMWGKRSKKVNVMFGKFKRLKQPSLVDVIKKFGLVVKRSSC